MNLLKSSLTTLAAYLVLAAHLLAAPNLIVTTDIGGDPDDQQAMRRLMLYSNEFNILGLIASAAGTPANGIPPVVNPNLITDIISDYGTVRTNLLLHASGYPTTTYLAGVTKGGNPNRGTAYIGASFDTTGSNFIISQVDAATDIVNVSIWGGATDLAQSLYRVRANRTTTQVNTFLAKLRVYAIGDQDGNSLAWIKTNFPTLWLIEASPSTINSYDSLFRGMYQNDSLVYGGTATQLVETAVVPLNQQAWINTNIRTGHGALGAGYPITEQNPPSTRNTMGGKEGDTPSWFYFLPNGLGDPAQPSWGGWGGRLTLVSGSYYTDAGAQDDHWSGSTNSGVRRKWTQARWRKYYQQDFQARMDWCVSAFGSANHQPVAVLNGDTTKNVLTATAVPGATVSLSATGSSDPDSGNTLSYKWWVYKEAGTYGGTVTVNNSTSAAANFTMPTGSTGASIHIILEVTDNGTPSLTAWRRLVVTGSGGSASTDPVGHWQLDESAGTSAADVSGSGNTGTLVNGPVWVAGTLGNALDFDGVNDYVNVPNSASLNLTKNFTLAAWISPDSVTGGTRTIIGKVTGADDKQYQLSLNPTGGVQFDYEKSGNNYSLTGGTVTAGTWQHLAVTVDASRNVKIYLNGTVVASGVGPAEVSATTNPLTIGRAAGTYNSLYFSGLVDDVRVYNLALDGTAVAALAAGGGTGGSQQYTVTVADSANAADWSIQDNLQAGNTQFGDRTVAFTSVPSALAGQAWLRTANDSRAYTGSPLVSIVLDEARDVYVAHNDAITTRPSWLTGWTDTGLNLVNNESPARTFSLYVKSFAAGSTVTLGANGSTSESMYTVIFKPASASELTLTVQDTANAGDWSFQDNLLAGNQQYGDRAFLFSSVPTAMSGLTWVRTANDSKAYTGNPVATLQLDGGMTVYVAHNDNITTKPSWLTGWTDTGLNLVNNEAVPKTFSLYSKTFAAGSAVPLGPNGSSTEGMYVVLLAPAP